MLNAQVDKSITLWAVASDTIGRVKSTIEVLEDIPPDQQQLFFQDKQLKDEHMLSDYLIQDHSTIILSLHSSSVLGFMVT